MHEQSQACFEDNPQVEFLLGLNSRSAAHSHHFHNHGITAIIFKFSDLDSDHFKATSYLQKLDKDHIIDTGGALGLYYSKLQKMTKYPDDMVSAWLRREDSVISTSGEPTWRALVEALRRVGQEGTARDIEAAKT